MNHPSFPNGITRDDLLTWFRRGREHSARVFTIPRAGVYYERPIALRNPIVFYEGHLPAFTVNTLVKLTLEQPGIDERYETLFARGIDPEDEAAAKSPTDLWPKRDDVVAYGHTADAMIERALTIGNIDVDQREAAIAILEHEQMHQETLLYMFHELGYEKKTARAPLDTAHSIPDEPMARTRDQVLVPAGVATLGSAAGSFGFAPGTRRRLLDRSL